MLEKINEKFTDIADKVSYAMGQWWVTFLSIIAVAVWLASGPAFHWSDTWQLIINTPTTVLEMWIGFLIAAAANRTERANRKLHETMLALIQKIETEEEEVLEHVKTIEVNTQDVVS